jgi:plastocyanin
MISKRLIAAVVALSVLVALAAAACSSAGQSAEPTPVQTFNVTPSALSAATEPPSSPTVVVPATTVPTAAASADATPSAEATGAATPAATTGGEGTKIVIIAQNLLFDKTSLTAPAGTITIELDNQDPGQPHNIHFYKGTDITGEDVGSTELKVGPANDLLTMTLDKGEYFYQCDVHPTTMLGTLTVN